MFIDMQIRPQGEQVDAVVPLKLSQAIRIGAKIRPKCTGCAFEYGKSCAWGAAWEGSGHPYEEGGSYAAIMGSSSEWEEANQSMTRKHGKGIASLNDGGASREQIAEWLETQGL